MAHRRVDRDEGGADAEAGTDRFANLRRIGIDEISYKRGRRYLTVVVDHDTGVLLWAHPGRDQKTFEKFFDPLSEERCAKITLVSADAAEWIANVVARPVQQRRAMPGSIPHRAMGDQGPR